MSIGERIKARRAHLDLTLQELADKLEVSFQQVWRYENDQNVPNSRIVVKMANALMVTTDWLLGLNDEMNSIPQTEGLNESEQTLIEIYRAQSPSFQQRFIDFMKTLPISER